eukprot:scaffold198175_cov96-Cyclotella_meneghiniana.AAC.2
MELLPHSWDKLCWRGSEHAFIFMLVEQTLAIWVYSSGGIELNGCGVELEPWLRVEKSWRQLRMGLCTLYSK